MNAIHSARLFPPNNDRISSKHAIIIFIIGVISSQQINIGGDLFIGEALAFFYFFAKHPLRQDKFEVNILMFAFLWALAQKASDIINQTSSLDSFKGVFAPILFSITIVGISKFFRNNNSRVAYFLIGVVIGQLIYRLIAPTPIFLGNPWKWGLGGVAFTFFSIYYSFFIKKEKLILVILFLSTFFIVSIYFNARSLAVFPLISWFLYVYFRYRKKSLFFNSFSKNKRFLIILLSIVFFVLIVNLILTPIFSSSIILDNFSKEAASKYSTQASGSYGVLLGGRSEILASLPAFLDKPIFGHGSWAKDSNGYISLYFQQLYELGYSNNNEDVETLGVNLIPVHSYLMGALVWAGLMGGLFWIFILKWLIDCICDYGNRLNYYFYSGITTLMWNILFSPFGASHRWTMAVFIGVLSSTIIYCKSFERKVIYT